MKILNRKVEVSKPEHEIIAILKSCAYYIPSAVFDGSTFCMHFPKRDNGRGPYLTQVRGEFHKNVNSVIVCLEIHANIQFFLGCILAGVGVGGLIFCTGTRTDNWFSCLWIILLGLLFCGYSLCKGVEILDHIEHKLTRKTDYGDESTGDGSAVPTPEDEN